MRLGFMECNKKERGQQQNGQFQRFLQLSSERVIIIYCEKGRKFDYHLPSLA